MAQYRVEFVTSAAKEFRSLPIEVKRRVSAALDALRENPRPLGVHKLQGRTDHYRIRVGTYRVVYEVDDRERLIHVTRVRHRRDVYR